MLWYKGWLETRVKVLVALGFMRVKGIPYSDSMSHALA
jgi:hypothetical protein